MFIRADILCRRDLGRNRREAEVYMRKRDLSSANWSILLNRYEYREFCENNRIKTFVSVQPKVF
jgi:hypothetical protein